jgi:hypothetical protein
MASQEYRYYVHRDPNDHAAAVSAFRRLHQYAVATEDRALATLAILKALQKLENEAEFDGKDLRALVLPAWVRSGIWDALAQLLGTKTARARSEPFTQSMGRLGLRYRRWAIIKKHLVENAGTAHSAAKALGDHTGGGSQKSLVRGYEYIETVIQKANEFKAFEAGKEPQLIEARDLIPTQRLEAILDK